MGSNKTPKSAIKSKGDDFWKSLIETTKLNDDYFNLKVIILEAAGCDNDFLYLSKFEIFAKEEKRYVVKNITKTETILMVNQLGTEKKAPTEDLRVFEEAYEILKISKYGFPTDISALVIKQQLLDIKKRYLNIKDQKQELKIGMKIESAIMIDRSEVKGTITKPLDRLETSIKKARNDVDSENNVTKECKKHNTLLREYGEDWRDKDYVEDFPVAGPNLYVAVTGFTDSFLPRELVRIGIPLVAVVQIRVDPILTNIPSSLMHSSKRGQSKTELLAEQATRFWNDIQNERIKPDVADFYKNIAFITFKPTYSKDDVLKGDPEHIYDELSFLFYDIQDLSRQHENYLDNIQIIHIKTEMEDSQLFDRYTHSIDTVPKECTTIFYMLDSILNAIDHKMDMSLTVNSETSNSAPLKTLNTSDGFSKFSDLKITHRVEESQNLVEKVFYSLQKLPKEQNREFNIKQDNVYDNLIVLNYGDYSSLKTFHLPVQLNFQNITNKMLVNMPLIKLWGNIKKTFGENEAKNNYHLNVLMNAFDKKDVEISELNRLIHIMGLKKMYNNRGSTAKTETIKNQLLDFKKCYLKRSDLSEPLNRINSFHNIPGSFTSSNHSIYKISPIVNTYDSKKDISPLSSFSLFECANISELISPAELLSKKASVHIIDNFEYFEDFDLHCSHQVLHGAFNEFNYVHYKYCQLSDSILMLFYNSHDGEGIFTKEWKTDLRTPLCMQDFFDFILDDNYEWIQSEEEAYDEMIQEQYYKENLEDVESTSDRYCLDESVLDMEMLIEGSLKHGAFLKDDYTSLESEKSSSPTKNKLNHPTIRADISKPYTKIQGIQVTGSYGSTSAKQSSFTEENKIKNFIGYDLGDRRVQVFGRDASFYSLDGSNITSKYFMFFPFNQEFVTLNFVSGNKNNELYLHKAVGSYTNPTIPTSLRIKTKNDVQIYWRKHFHDVFSTPIQCRNGSEPFVTPTSPMGKLTTDDVPEPTVEFYFPFIIHCPNGLQVESIHMDKSMAISHIKQTFLKDLKNNPETDNEEKRCITKSGEVIIFKLSGNIEVLFPDSSFILCTKYESILIKNDLNLKPISSGITLLSDKKKDTKGRNTKETQDRSKSENLKSRDHDSNLTHFEDKPEDEPIYELVFLEYVVIEADGKKKQFIDNHFEEKEVLLIRTATDYCLGEVFSRRSDGTHTLYSNDGMLTVTFANGTRIISSFFIEENDVLPDWTEEECTAFNILKTISSSTFTGSMNQYSNSSKSSDSFESLKEEEMFKEVIREEGFLSIQSIHIIEHTNYATVTVDTSNHEFIVDMPNSLSVTINDQSHYKIKLDSKTTASFDSHNFHISYKPCANCSFKTSCVVNMTDEPFDENNIIKAKWLWLRDSCGKCVSIDYEGILKSHEDDSSEHVWPKQDSTKDELPKRENSDISKESSQSCNCKEEHLSNSLRFLVLHRDLTVSELVHKHLVKEYMRSCVLQPWCSVSDYDVFGDNRKLLSILFPIDRNESEKWLMDSKFACKPQDLVFKDLRADEGKGFYKWMRPYGRFQPEPRKPPPAVAPGLPRALILRTLEHLWKDEDPEVKKGGRELFNAIIKYVKIMDEDKETMTADPVRDPRSKEVVDEYQRIQELAERTIGKMVLEMEKYKKEHGGDANLLEVIKIPVKSNHSAPLQGEDITEVTSQSTLQTSVAAEEALQELEEIVPMSSQLAHYWKVRAEENKQEQFFKEVLRQGTVPPYFENIFGGAVWWDMNNAAGDAVAASEDAKRSRCCCRREPEVSCEIGTQQHGVRSEHETSCGSETQQYGV